MDAMNVTQQMIAFQKQSIDSFQSIWDLIQSQTSSTVDRILDQSAWMPQEGRQVVENWRTLMKQERERFAAYGDRSFAIYEKMFSVPLATTPAKTKSTTTSK